MDNCFYIGTRERMFQMRAPSVNMPSSKAGFQNDLNFLNGGASVRRSVTAHKNYVMTWNVLSRDEGRIILDLADGLYGLGPIYWLDPLAANRNMLPQQWASPFQGTADGLSLNNGPKPQRVRTVANSLGFPIASARYEVATPNTKRVWVPIPEGHVAHVGVFGQEVTNGKMFAIPTRADGVAVQPVELTLMSVNDDSRFNKSFASSDGFNGVFLRLGGSGFITLSGMMVQVLPEGQTPESGGFISGQGHSGARFTEQPAYTPFSAALDQVSVVATFVETESWE